MLLYLRAGRLQDDHTPRTQRHVDNGYATLSFETPGTGDCPAAPNDPTSAERLMTSVPDCARKWVCNVSTLLANTRFDRLAPKADGKPRGRPF